MQIKLSSAAHRYESVLGGRNLSAEDLPLDDMAQANDVRRYTPEGQTAECGRRAEREPMTKRAVHIVVALSLLLLSGLTNATVADAGNGSKIVDDVQIFMGILPAEMIQGHPQDHPENSMHGGQPTASGEYHIVIAIFDATSGTRITDANATAQVSEIGLAGNQKKLNPMLIAGAMTYGNYFTMPGNGPFRISLTIHVPGKAQDIKAEFEHRHQLSKT